ncbi:NADP-dependent oxidoreductase [Acrocarpospora catenulata]|uniref:NADP-dependent oxidoreductase n=1 Tax=Acrocarpospora catenulata TaxID=2836182 RepID=UPI001BDA8891|nr:NADP-dependent oxidoreductase [Acrocarpospora catenulata]
MDRIPDGQSEATELRLRAYPRDTLHEEDFEFHRAPVPRSLEAGELLLANSWLSLDASARLRMRESDSPYMPRITLGAPISGFALGRVLSSRRPGFAEGDLVLHSSGWRTHAVIRADETGWRGPHRIAEEPGLPEAAYLTALGPAGLTAYVGMVKLLDPRPGEVVYVSAAGGGIGSLAVQLAKFAGARVVASAGSAEKRDFVLGLGADVALDRRAPDLSAALKAAAPDGIHGYFDCVGGPELEAAIDNARPRARIVMCGTVSNYDTQSASAPRNLFDIVAKELSVQGYLTRSYAELLPTVQAEMAKLVRDGRLRDRVTILMGIDSVPRAFVSLFRGEHIGKLLIQV